VSSVISAPARRDVPREGRILEIVLQAAATFAAGVSNAPIDMSA
jgi:hypothetical protein